MNILGKLPESTAVTGSIDYVGLLKIFRTAIVTGIAAICAYVLSALVGFHLFESDAINSIVVTGILVPLVETVRRWATDYAAT
jgi:hypothetical protein